MYKLKQENPLWRKYMDKTHNDMKEIKLNIPFPSKSFSTYSQDEFEYLLINDTQFNKKWGN